MQDFSDEPLGTTEGDDPAWREATGRYHAPPPVPQDLLWARIEAARAAERSSRAASVVPIDGRRRPAWLAWPLAAAALVMLGVGLGRWTAGTSATTITTAARTPAAPSAELPAAYRITAERHFAQAEALLTLVRASAKQGQVGPYAPEAARTLLASNRLLSDSPAAADPKLRVLLDELELVLAQIAQLPPTRAREDLDFVAAGIDQGGVLVRLRTAVPSGGAVRFNSGEL